MLVLIISFYFVYILWAYIYSVMFEHGRKLTGMYIWMSVIGVQKVSQSAQYDDDDDCFYIALFSSLEQTHCARLLTSD